MVSIKQKFKKINPYRAINIIVSLEISSDLWAFDSQQDCQNNSM